MILMPRKYRLNGTLGCTTYARTPHKKTESCRICRLLGRPYVYPFTTWSQQSLNFLNAAIC